MPLLGVVPRLVAGVVAGVVVVAAAGGGYLAMNGDGTAEVVDGWQLASVEVPDDGLERYPEGKPR